ncbi:MAG: signal recognition particle-docking protein FtsY [Methanomassiliicoccaceae archaeon]|nr:signal recognition particle-docking protein FtsY [Methanomassiliicoccaceae archaeon]
MFDSLKNKFKNLFKKDQPEAEEVTLPADDRPKDIAVKERGPKEKARVFDDDDDDFEFGDDLISDDDLFEDDGPEDDDVPERPVKDKTVKEPARKEPAVRKEPSVKKEPAPAPAPADEGGPSKKERIKLAKQAAKEKKAAAKQEKIEAKQERVAAKEAVKYADKKQDDGELVGDSGKKIKEGNLGSLLWELEVALMEADVALPVVEEIVSGVKEDLTGKRYARGHTLDEVVETSLKNSISNILKLNEFDFDAWFLTKDRPVVVMFVGINGTGKTTAIAKIANRLMKEGRTVVLAASDTFRAGAIEQLTIHSERLGCKIVKHSADADPAAVAFDAIEHAKAKRRDAVLVDTAGRMQTNSNLMDEMKKIKKVARPDLVMFVGDSLAGNDAVEQARAFDAAIGVDAIMLTKIDADSKGGAALSIAHTIGKPIAFVSNGQEYDQIIKFSSKWMMDRLFED